MSAHKTRKVEIAEERKGYSWSKIDGPLLVRIVKQCQKKDSSGALGNWKTFLKVKYPKFRSADPSQHHWKVLAAFVDSLEAGDDVDMVTRHIDWEQLVRSERAALALKQTGNRGGPAESSFPGWELVKLTARHPRFKELYSLPSFDKYWHRLRGNAQQSEAPVLYGLDCEMCATATDASALVRVCLVDMDGKSVLDMVVKPKKRIVDYRTHVTGLTPDSFQGITKRRKDAQLALKALLKGNVVLVGHALYHDLLALRIDYQPVIDTSLLISYRQLSSCVPSLADLSRAVLGRVLREEGAPHDCRADAWAALQLAQHLLQRGATLVLDPPQLKVPKEQLSKLLVHGIPEGTAEPDLRAMLAAASAPEALHLEGDCGRGRKVLLDFGNAEKANEAFKALQGEQHKDSLGRAQKAVLLQTGANSGKLVRVRKMGAHGGLMHGRDAKRDRGRQPAEKQKLPIKRSRATLEAN